MSPRKRLHPKLPLVGTILVFLAACTITNFTFTLDSATLTVASGLNGTVTVTLDRKNNFAGPVNVTLNAVAPEEAGITMAAVTIAGSASTGDLTVAVADTVAAGTYTLTIMAAGSTNATAEFTLTVVEPASVRVLHGVSDAPAPVDVSVDGVEVLSSVEFKEASAYLPVAPGERAVSVALMTTGTPTPLLTETLTLEAGTSYTVIAIGTADPADAFDIEALVFKDDSAPRAGLFKLRVVQASTSVEAASPASAGVDVFLSFFGKSLPLLPTASFVYKDIVDVPKGAPTPLPLGSSYQVRAAPGGTTGIIYDSGEIDLEALGASGKALVAVAVNGAAPDLVTILVLTGDDLEPVLEFPTVP